jgi:hypothetical protein
MRWAAVILLMLGALRVDAAVALVNAALPVERLSIERVRDLLLGRVTTWETGQPVTIILCTDQEGEPAITRICGRSTSLLQRGWKRLVFSGTGAMPLVVASRQAGIDAIARHPGALMVLQDAQPATGCRVIPIDEVVPPKTGQ